MNNPSEHDPLEGRLSGLTEGRQVRLLRTCDSTNRVARRELEAGEGPGLLVVAESQSAGRGRMGRTWDAEPGSSLLFSLVLQPRVSSEKMARCVLVWAAAMAEVLDCRLKWPNDLQDPQGAKLGGILAELIAPATSSPREWQVILGVGININQSELPGLPEATSLRRMRGKVQDRATILEDLVRAIESIDPSDSAGLDRWRQRSNTLGRWVRVGSLEGVAEAIREDGALVVNGQPVLAGDVQLLTPAKLGSGC